MDLNKYEFSPTIFILPIKYFNKKKQKDIDSYQILLGWLDWIDF